MGVVCLDPGSPVLPRQLQYSRSNPHRSGDLCLKVAFLMSLTETLLCQDVPYNREVGKMTLPGDRFYP